MAGMSVIVVASIRKGIEKSCLTGVHIESVELELVSLAEGSSVDCIAASRM